MFYFNISVHAPIDLEATLFCGQAFRWQREVLHNKNYYNGIVAGNFIRIYHDKSTSKLEIEASSDIIAGMPADRFIRHYLDIDAPDQKILSETFLAHYPFARKVLHLYGSMQVLHQEPFEALISFICAQGMGIHIVRRQVESLSASFGEALYTKDRSMIHKFPAPESLARADFAMLQKCANNNVRRAKNIQQISEAVASGALELECLMSAKNGSTYASYRQARQVLLRYSGIGGKIADCVCLFGFGHKDAIPIDRHVRTYLSEWFGLSTKTSALSSKNYDALADEARALFASPCPGRLSQILFHYWRMHVRGLKAV